MPTGWSPRPLSRWGRSQEISNGWRLRFFLLGAGLPQQLSNRWWCPASNLGRAEITQQAYQAVRPCQIGVAVVVSPGAGFGKALVHRGKAQLQLYDLINHCALHCCRLIATLQHEFMVCVADKLGHAATAVDTA